MKIILNKEELRSRILLFDKSRGETGYNAVTGRITKKEADVQFENDINSMIDLIEEQKIAHADMIIGNDKSETDPYDINLYQNNLRAKQRERNK